LLGSPRPTAFPVTLAIRTLRPPLGAYPPTPDSGGWVELPRTSMVTPDAGKTPIVSRGTGHSSFFLRRTVPPLLPPISENVQGPPNRPHHFVTRCCFLRSTTSRPPAPPVLGRLRRRSPQAAGAGGLIVSRSRCPLGQTKGDVPHHPPGPVAPAPHLSPRLPNLRSPSKSIRSSSIVTGSTQRDHIPSSREGSKSGRS